MPNNQISKVNNRDRGPGTVKFVLRCYDVAMLFLSGIEIDEFNVHEFSSFKFYNYFIK